MKTDWQKRREPTKNKKEVINFKVKNFKKMENSYCDVNVEYSNGEIIKFEARVSGSYTYIIGGGKINPKRTIQGINCQETRY